MSEHRPQTEFANERLRLGAGARRLYLALSAIAVACLIGGAAAAGFASHPLKRFLHAYLVNWVYVLSIGLGCLLFVMVQHLARAGWSVSVRRIAEKLAGTLPVAALLSLPLVLAVLMHRGDLYPWAGHGEHAGAHHGPEMSAGKQAYFGAWFWTARVAVCLAVVSVLAWWYRRVSVRQDQQQNFAPTRTMERLAAPGILAAFLALTLLSFDMLMSLDPHWYSTIFGVYFFSGSAVAAFAAVILCLWLLQKTGHLTVSVTAEHYHDLGKFLFGFTFFWGYIAFSQYMLLWYANIPETTGWLVRRGASTVAEHMNGWTAVCVLLLVGHLLIPFGALLPRTVKRRPGLLAFWAAWLLVFHWIDLWWLVMPQLDGRVYLGLPEVLTFAGLLAALAAAALRLAMGQSLRPMHDPRLEESLVYVNA